MKRSSSLWRALALCSVLLFTFAALSGCGTHGGQAATEWKEFRGEITWVPRGRDGSWGIRTREFGRVHPLGSVDSEFHRDGLRVTGELLMRNDMGSVRAWGKVAEIRNLALDQ